MNGDAEINIVQENVGNPTVIPNDPRSWLDPVTKKFIKGNPGNFLGKKQPPKPLDTFLKGIEDMAPDVLPIGKAILQKGSLKDKLVIWKVYVDKFIPAEIVHKHLSLLIKGDLQGLQDHTQSFGLGLRLNSLKALAAQGVDVKDQVQALLEEITSPNTKAIEPEPQNHDVGEDQVE